MWLVAEGKRVEYAEEIYSITQSDDGKKLSLLCPTMQIHSRGDTLNRPTITVVSLLNQTVSCTYGANNLRTSKQ